LISNFSDLPFVFLLVVFLALSITISL